MEEYYDCYDWSDNGIESMIQSFLLCISKVESKNDVTEEEESYYYCKNTSELVKLFRTAFGIKEQNKLRFDENVGVKSYNLFICDNPLDEKMVQLFYTLFSEDIDHAQKITDIYQHYLKEREDLHIDTMLQIGYSKNKKIVESASNGFYLDLDFTDSDKPLIKIIKSNSSEEDGIVLFDLVRDAIMSCLTKCENLINKYQWNSNNDSNNRKQIDRCINEIETTITAHVSDLKENAFVFSRYACYDSLEEAFLNIRCKSEKEGISGETVVSNIFRVLIINRLFVKDVKYVYFIPVPFPNKNKLGHFTLFTTKKIEPNLLGKLRTLSFVMMYPVAQLNLDAINMKKVRDDSIKAAKAAIMSRNMSHNIGSHVMSYLKQHLGSVKDIVADGILSDLINGESELAKKLENTTENTTLPFLMGLGHFISYLQERQDFIATIATDFIPYFGNVNFKDAIYDELNPDKRAERHSERKNGKTDNILLGNIARSEGLGRKTTITADNQIKEIGLRDIVLRFRNSFDGNRVVETDDSGNRKGIIDQAAYNELEEMRKYDFSLPGGIVGRQAFFSIMENIIRNAAKHGNWREQKNLEFTFDIFSCKKKDIDRLPSNDNVNEHCLSLKEVIERFYLNAKDAKDLYFVTITDNCNFTTVSKSGDVLLTALGKLRNALTSNYISDSGEMENENKGLKEMRISAAWMRAIKDESMCFSPYIHVNENEETKLLEFDKFEKDTDVWKTKNTHQKAPLLYARISAKKVYDDDEEFVIGRNLQYIFCVQIPKKVAVILNNSEIEIETINNNLERINWRAYTVEGFSKERNRSYEFILIDDECGNIEQTYFDIRSEATARTFLFSEIKDLDRNLFVKRLKEANYDGKDDLRMFYKSLADYQESDIIIVDDKTAAIRNKDKNNVHISVGDGINKEGIKYIYRRHHEAEMEFTAFMTSKMKDSVEFVEGISGNNSTDRLIRNEELDDSWFYRHLRAMKQQIAIFDERLFSKITGLEESDFNGSNIALCKDNTALSYIQKGIYPFTFISDKTNGNIKLIGVLFDKQPLFEEQIVRDDPQAPVHSYKCFCGCIANITFKDKQLKTDYNNYGEYIKKHFHAVTIHQGLLDKIYELFEIKGSETEKSDKGIITNNLFQIFSCNRPVVLEEANVAEKVLKKEFLPGLIIHSGRSKPNESDMPQKLPFIQYAALEHAVMDCKYSLVELLDFARYES